MNRVWTWSNALSVLRLLLVVPVCMLLLTGRPADRIIAAALIALAALTDLLDGAVARRRGEVTRLGIIIDPVADKIGIGAVTLILAIEGTLPVWFAAAVLARDAAILAAALFLSRRDAAVPQSNLAGKWAAAVVGAALFLAVIDPRNSTGALMPLIVAGAFMILVSAVLYARRIAPRDNPTTASN